jgi:CRISPR-associated protein Cas1
MPSNVSILGEDGVLTIDMLKQYTYCPRLFHLMYVEGRWDDNAYTVEGRHVHRRVDQLDHLLPELAGAGLADSPSVKKAKEGAGGEAVDPDKPVVSRSVPLASEELKLSAKLDLVATDGDEAVPVETKRGNVPNNSDRCYDTHRVQLMAQGLLLREHGFNSDHGVVYFAGSKTRVEVPFTPALEMQTLQMIYATREAATNDKIPPPLDHSPKCTGCSLAGICLPDETLALQWNVENLVQVGVSTPVKPRHHEGDEEPTMIRRLYPPRPDATPLYVQEQGAYVSKSGNSLVVKLTNGEMGTRAGLKDISQLVLCGNIQVSTQALHLLCEADIPICYLSSGMWFHGLMHGHTLRNAYDRAAQFAAAASPARCLDFAKSIVLDKSENQRTVIRRNASPSRELDLALSDMDELISNRIPHAQSLASLLGFEGNVAARYFSQFATMLKPRDFESTWDFHSRNRRPPRDPVNAMLSFAYALLAKECTVALLCEGLDPYWGFYHQPRHGRPALALDLMEPLRPVIADSVVITAINNGMVTKSDFETAASGCAMNSGGRKALLKAYENRLDQLVTHPIFDYRCSWRSIIRLQARLLARWLRGDIASFTNLVTR